MLHLEQNIVRMKFIFRKNLESLLKKIVSFKYNFITTSASLL